MSKHKLHEWEEQAEGVPRGLYPGPSLPWDSLLENPASWPVLSQGLQSLSNLKAILSAPLLILSIHSLHHFTGLNFLALHPESWLMHVGSLRRPREPHHTCPPREISSQGHKWRPGHLPDCSWRRSWRHNLVWEPRGAANQIPESDTASQTTG